MPPEFLSVCLKFCSNGNLLKGQKIRGPRTTHHPHKRPSSSGGIFGGVVCELSEPKKKKGKIRTTPSFALAMLIVDFVGVVRGFRGLKDALEKGVLLRLQNTIFKAFESLENCLEHALLLPHVCRRSGRIFSADFLADFVKSTCERACLTGVALAATTGEAQNPTRSSLLKPQTSFEAKKWLEVNFASRGKVKNFPSRRKSPFFPNPSFPGETVHSKGKGKLFSRENYPSEGKFSL